MSGRAIRRKTGEHSLGPAGPDTSGTGSMHARRRGGPVGGSTRALTAQVEQFSDFFSWRAMRLFAVLYIVGISNGIAMTIVLVGLLAWSVTGTRQAIMAMSLVALYRVTNGAVASFSPFANVLFWLVAIVASARLYRDARGLPAPFVWVTAFAVVAAMLSLMVSKAPDISLMKVLSFFIVSSALLLASQRLQSADVAWLQKWFFSIALLMAALSILTAAVPSIGFRKVAGSLQGMFNHPQAAGIFFVPFASWFVARVFVEPVRYLPRWVLAMAALFSALIVASHSRTAMLATFLSVGVTLTILLVKGRKGAHTRSRGQLLGVAVLMALLSTAILASGVLNDEFESLVKKGDDTSVAEAFQSSRGAGMAKHVENFLGAPLTGHGFGVYPHGVRGGEGHVKRVLGIPFSASAEKGIAFTSVLEEVGIVGATLFYGLLLSIVGGMARGHSLGALAMVVGTITVNFGEAIIFSTGGMGLFMWLIAGFGLARGRFGASLLESPSGAPKTIGTRRRPALLRNPQ